MICKITLKRCCFLLFYTLLMTPPTLALGNNNKKITLLHNTNTATRYSFDQTPTNLSGGGQINSTFGKIAGPRSGQSYISGYMWLSSYHPLDKDVGIVGNFGFSLEKEMLDDIIFNDASIGIRTPNHHAYLGRTLNAAGKLHHDISDFGAPGAGTDNQAVSDFAMGSFSTNVAQKLTQPFDNRISFYSKPIWHDTVFGFSYAPSIDTYHPAGYQFFAETPVSNEISVASSSEWTFKNYFLGITAGYTTAERRYSRIKPQDRIHANQISVRLNRMISAKKNKEYIYEYNAGCLQDKQVQDCREAFQLSKKSGVWKRSTGVQTRRYQNQDFYDYHTGISYDLADNLTIGGETIYRIQKIGRQTRTDINWLAGVAIKF